MQSFQKAAGFNPKNGKTHRQNRRTTEKSRRNGRTFIRMTIIIRADKQTDRYIQ